MGSLGNRIVQTFFVVVLGAAVLAANEVEPKEPVYQQTSRMVVHLEVKHPVSGEFMTQGTGFFVRDENNQLYIVTARHVADIRMDLRARVSSMLKVTRKTDVVELKLPSARWIYHPQAGDEKTMAVDVAVMKIPYIVDRSLITLRYCKTDCPTGEYNQLADDAAPPDHILIFGFPRDLGGIVLTEQRPMTRQGVVSMTSDEQFLKIEVSPGVMKRVPKGAFLIDARMFSGNSGGPVIIANPVAPFRLGGLVTGSNRALDYGVATPVKQITETIDLAKDTVGNFPAWFSMAPVKTAQK